MKTQTFTSPSGDEMIILSRADYDALVAAAGEDAEDAADVAIYDARKAEIAAGRDAHLPVEVSAFMLGGDSLVRALRKWRGLTQQQMAEKTGIGQGYLSDIETGRRNGAPDTLMLIAKTLDAPSEWLIEEER